MTEAGRPVNLRINGSQLILSFEQARFLHARKEQGYSPECLCCHFKTRYLRELEPDDIETILG
jgi:hypothetical protein